MKLKYWCLSVFSTLFALFVDVAVAKKAVFRTPVADLFFEQQTAVYGRQDPDVVCLNALYSSNPLFATTRWGCPRAIQCLFNEVVEVRAWVGDEVCVSVPHIFYTCPDRTLFHTIFWTHVKNLMFFDDEATVFPDPITYHQPDSVLNGKVLTLSMPWFDPATQQDYSVGTRFVRVPEQDTLTSFAVRLWDMSELKEKQSFITRDSAVIFQEFSEQERQANFVTLLRRWADKSNGVLPYVWGGASITRFLSNDDFVPSYTKFAGKLVALWSHPESVQPHSGVDCSLMILRAAQICGIPYFFKNSYSISQFLRPFKRGEELEEGDIIWYDGHVIVVSDIENNKIIESCGYPFGFGKLQEIDIGKRLAGIHTYEDLVASYFNGEYLGSLDRDGVARRIVDGFKIFKFSSVWDFASQASLKLPVV